MFLFSCLNQCNLMVCLVVSGMSTQFYVSRLGIYLVLVVLFYLLDQKWFSYSYSCCTLVSYGFSCIESFGHLLKSPFPNPSCGFNFVPVIYRQVIRYFFLCKFASIDLDQEQFFLSFVFLWSFHLFYMI